MIPIKLKYLCVCRDAFETKEEFLEHTKYCPIFKDYLKSQKKEEAEQQ